MTIHQLLELTVAKQASDLHLIVGYQPQLRINSELYPIPGTDPITPEEIKLLIKPLITNHQEEVYLKNLELDFSFQIQDKSRFRVNAYFQNSNPAAAFRLIPSRIRTLAELGFPLLVNQLAELRQGFVLITGPTGHGKTTTLASFINHINMTRHAHVITIEDPVEFIYPKGKSLISQREMFKDTRSWTNALKSALREDPDVVLVGEMRDFETIAAAMTLAETGHLVFATLHTNSAGQSIDRIIDVFPENQQAQIRIQLASTLEAVLSLRLVPTVTPGRAMAIEILLADPAVRSIIREAKNYMIDNLILTSSEAGMTTMENSLVALVREGRVSMDVALKYAIRPDLLNKLFKKYPDYSNQ